MKPKSQFQSGPLFRLISLVALLTLAIPAHATIAFVQKASKDQSTSVTSTTLAYGSNVAANNLLIVTVRGGSGLTSITITDSIGNSYSNGTFHAVGGTASVQISFAVNTTSSANTVTITPNATSSLRIAIEEYSGAATGSPLDAQNNTQSGSSNAPASSSVTPAANNELVFAVVATGNNTGECTSVAGTNFTFRDTVGTNCTLLTEEWIQTTATATTGPVALLASDTWLAAIAVFKIAGGGGPSPTTFPQVVKGGHGEITVPIVRDAGHGSHDRR